MQQALSFYVRPLYLSAGNTLFQRTGLDVDAVLDRLPTAKILDEKDGVYLITAEVFGKGIEMWLRSQGSDVEVLQAADC